MISTISTPTEPFLLDETGKYLENLIFDDPHLALNWSEDVSPALNSHLDFLLEAGEKLEAIPYCPYCKVNKVESFVFKSGVTRYDLMSCNHKDCRSKLYHDSHPDNSQPGVIFPISTSALFLFSDQPEAKQKIGRFLKNIIGLPRNASANMILEKLTQSYHAQARSLAS